MMLWDKSYELGIKEVDDQHLQWLLITEKLLDALVIGNVKSNIDSVFDELFEYTSYHFSYEEDLLAANSYPQLEHHKALHADLVSCLKGIRSRMVDSNYQHSDETITSEVVELVGLCQRWLIEHIEREDRKCVDYLRMSA